MRLSEPVPISASHETTSFDCGESDLDNWLKTRALRNEGRYARTYVVCNGDAVAGYYCLSAAQVERATVPRKLGRNAPEDIPVSVLGRLAVDRRYQGRGIGADLLADAIQNVGIAARIMGIAAILIHAKSDAAKAFYMAQAEFIEYPSDSRILFLAIETLPDFQA